MSGYDVKQEKSTPAKPIKNNSVRQKQSPDRETLQLSRILNKAAIQPKLKIGKPHDRYEQEADRIAERVTATPDSSSIVAPVVGGITPLTVQRQQEEEEEIQTKLLQRQSEEEEEEEAAQPKLQRQPLEEEEEAIQTKRAGRPTVAPDALCGKLQALRGSGRPLPASERAFFEPRFGHDFSAVRIHDGGQAADAAGSIQAKAFTAGRDIAFGTGQYAPGTGVGRKLLAHELTHVIQQKGVKRQK